MCVYFDPTVPKQCREDDAIEVNAQDKERANFCDWFKPSDQTFDGSFVAGEAQAKQGLDALFGGDESDTDGDASPAGDDAGSEAEKLFK